jgi:signal transduction histidine kinase/DNA-binding LacI/PurR family transcriptional regulator/AraC-like DNA-binding protein
MEDHPPERSRTARLTIGYLATAIGDGTARLLWSGIYELCQANDINLVSFTGSELESPGGFSRQSNLIYDMVDRGRLDGLVIWASSLAAYVGPDVIQRFCERYRPLPLVGVGLPLKGVPSIILDSYQGMRDALLHLVEEHGRRRVAFIRGPHQHREAQLRYQAYNHIVKEFGLENDVRLVTPPNNWERSWGAAATRLLVEERGMTFDAIACVNDGLAVGAIEYLQARGVKIPDDVAIIGFDNIPEGRVITPPLTTVPIRMKERGRQAVRNLLAQIHGEAVPALVTLPTKVRLRQSCGCPDPMVVEAGLASSMMILTRPAGEKRSWQEQVAVHRTEILSEMEHVLDLDETTPDWASNLLDAFLNKINSDAASGFPTTLQRLLRHSAQAGGDLIAWQKVVSVLRARVVSLLQPGTDQLERAERYLHQARVMISEGAVRAQGYLEWKKAEELDELLRIRQVVSGAQTLQELVETLARELPVLNIRRCYLSLYVDPQAPIKGARLVLAYDETRRYKEREGQVFSPSWRLTPLGLEASQPQNLVVYPLYYRDEQLGFISLDARVFQGRVHQLLCEQVSSALKSVLLVEQNLQLYYQALEAQHVAEEANLLKSRFLSMVSHELLTPMVLLVGLSEMMLREGIGDRPPLPEAYRQDMTRIHAGAQQLGSLVRDVLDLARSQLGQLKLARKPMNLEDMLKPVVLVGEQMTHSKGLTWRAEIPSVLPQVLGDAARLQQVALNLVSNAVKFTSQGEVALIVDLEDDQVTVSIQDTGLGVPLAEQEAIFDEFRQSERTVSRGYGGLGIGLAICRQLIEMHDGKLGVRSSGSENGGSTFYFTLPVLEAPPILPQAASSQSVLVLTSQAARAVRLREHLVTEGFQVEILGIDESPDWLASVLAEPPGAIVLDIPVAEQGWELMELLKNNLATQEIPVIFYSFLQEQSSGSMLALDYLTKPVAGDALSDAIERFGLSASTSNGHCTILLADDDPEILDMHARMVQEHVPHCKVLRAANGRIALELMQDTVPSLVLLDLMMPELSGTGVLRAMHEDERLRSVPVIVLTAQTLSQEEMAGLNQGVAAVLSKGVFSAEETLAHIDQALSRSKRLGTENQRLVRKVMAYMHEHYPEALSRERLASYAGVSERHLNRCFLQETGLAPGSYLNRYRIQKARCLLVENDLSITAVMGSVGFSDSSYFTRVFRREVGMSPSEYQRIKRGNGC